MRTDWGCHCAACLQHSMHTQGGHCHRERIFRVFSCISLWEVPFSVCPGHDNEVGEGYMQVLWFTFAASAVQVRWAMFQN